MTHEYTLLVGGVVILGGDIADATAIAWAGGTILAVGTDDAVLAISRGDSLLVDLDGGIVIPLADDADAAWPVEMTLEVGGPADVAVLDGDPRRVSVNGWAGDAGEAPIRTLALFRGGRLVAGALPGVSKHGDD